MEAGSIALLDTGTSKIFLPAYIFFELKRALDGGRMLSDGFLVDCSKFERFPPIHLLMAKHRFTLYAEDYIVRVILSSELLIGPVLICFRTDIIHEHINVVSSFGDYAFSNKLSRRRTRQQPPEQQMTSASGLPIV
ncbi:hypothetical protein CSKR_203675 [Clonorchis sinensis]|nr:hypothetical protein CSKR_203675 [Clonorchis sinensis]